MHMYDDIIITRGDKKEAISIMREAANWLIDSGEALWSIEELTEEKLNYSDDEFIVLRQDNKSIASMILICDDDYIWSEAKSKSSAFIHKLSVKREFAGLGYGDILIKYAKLSSQKMKLLYLRLDCDSKRNKRHFMKEMDLNLLK